MNLSADNIFGCALCLAVFVVAMVTFKKGAVPPVNYLGVLSYPLYLVHQDLGLLGIVVLKPGVGQLAAALLVVVLPVAAAAVVQPIAVWLMTVLRREWPFWSTR
jgi:peptidoglycan/LPS O-acetylase OafA/YrhL